MRAEITASCPCGASPRRLRPGPARCVACGRAFVVELTPGQAAALAAVERRHVRRRRHGLVAVLATVLLALAVRPGPEAIALVVALGAIAALAVQAIALEGFRADVARLAIWTATPVSLAGPGDAPGRSAGSAGSARPPDVAARS